MVEVGCVCVIPVRRFADRRVTDGRPCDGARVMAEHRQTVLHTRRLSNAMGAVTGGGSLSSQWQDEKGGAVMKVFVAGATGALGRPLVPRQRPRNAA